MNSQVQIHLASILHNNRLLPMATFKSYRFSKYNLFPHASTLPTFFENNLQGDGRIVKYLKGPEAALRGFYYQLFKLGFEIKRFPLEYYTNIIKNVIFDPSLIQNQPSYRFGKQYSFNQYLRIIAEVMKILETQTIPNAELIFNQYPIIDEAMITILQLIVQKAHKRKDSIISVLATLSQIFQITLEIYRNCLSFKQSDVFLYMEECESCYLTFLSEMAQIESLETSSSHVNTRKDLDRKQQRTSIAYMENIHELKQSPGYRNVRLSAGNKGMRPKIVNKNGEKSNSYNNVNNFKTCGNVQYAHEHFAYKDRLPSQSEHQLFQNIQIQNSVIESENPSSNQAFHNQNNTDEWNKKCKSTLQLSSNEQLRKQKQDSSQIQQNIQSLYKILLSFQPNEPSIHYKTQEVAQELHNNFQYMQNIHKIRISNSNLIRKILSDPEELFKSFCRESQSDLKAKVQRLSIKLGPFLDGLRTFQSISDDYSSSSQNKILLIQSSRQINPPKSEENILKESKKEVNSIPNYEIRTQRASVKLNNTVFQYEFKSHKYESSNNQINQNIPANGFKKQKQNLCQAGKTNIIPPLITQISNMTTRETVNTISSFNELSTIKDERLDYHHFNEIPIPIQPISNLLPQKENNEEDMNFYNPSASKKKVLTEKVKQNKNKLQNALNKNLGQNMDQTLGTFYREFSDTKVMEAMSQPCNTNVRKIRQKFKGIKSKNWKGFA